MTKEEAIEGLKKLRTFHNGNYAPQIDMAIKALQGMSYEELKEEAKRQGYKLIKKQPYIRKLPCVCGRKRQTLWFGSLGYFYACECGRRSVGASTEKKAKIEWNEMISEEMNYGDTTDGDRYAEIRDHNYDRFRRKSVERVHSSD